MLPCGQIRLERKCVFQVTCHFKIGTVGGFCFVQKFYRGMIGKQKTKKLGSGVKK